MSCPDYSHDYRHVGMRYVDGMQRAGSSARYRYYFHSYRCCRCADVIIDRIPGDVGYPTDSGTKLYDAVPAGEDERNVYDPTGRTWGRW